ncbi:unnamed protein product [Blepharisma stoltei]|uniref:Palmitoyltransferase n=1 Tax=Blepharisma stoltei TaxID=1481888 RepID=A0AAU9IBG5_9CILI|nr:unnamed protein product [Blepharisma stoltei]
MEDWAPFYQLITENRSKDIESSLLNYHESLQYISDANGFTLIHSCVIHEKEAILDCLIKHEKSLPDANNALILNWINKPNRDGYTPYHLAITKGNLTMVKYLTLSGADIDIKTPLGLGPVHLAAQGDFADLVAYFAEIGISLMDTDSKQATPLHLAAYMGAYYSSAVLVSLNVPFDSKNRDGHTPLHLAVLSDNARIVRLLLLKGASRSIKDAKGRTPLHISKESGLIDIVDMLKPEGVLAKCGYKPLLSPYKYSVRPFIILCTLLLTVSVLAIVFCSQYHTLACYSFAASAIFVLIMLVIVSNINPGYLFKLKGDKLSRLYQDHNYNEICPDCIILRPPRSRHCHYCERCVSKFDHHCQWVNNCIGSRNLGWFYGFIWSLWISDFLLLYICSHAFVFGSKQGGEIEKLPYFESDFIAGLLGALGLLGIFPISYLVVIQTKNFCINKTTSEQFSKGASKDKTNENKNCWLSNFYLMCCNEGEGSYKHGAKSFSSTNSKASDYQMMFEEST